MRRVFLLLALTACASAGTSTNEDPGGRQATIYSDPSAPTILAEKPRAVEASFSQPAAQVWVAVKKVYADWQVPLTAENPAAHQLGNNDFFRSRQFAGHPMTDFVDCGSGMTGPKASTYRIYMSLLTLVSGDGKGGTTVRTTFVASGQDVSGGSADRIICGTSGRLEQLFNDQLKAILGS